MTNSDTKKFAKAAKKPQARRDILPKRTKTSVYLDEVVWANFRELTAYPRGLTSEILEQFMRDYVEVNKKK